MKLVILAFLYCGEFVKNSNDGLSRPAGIQLTHTRVNADYTQVFVVKIKRTWERYFPPGVLRSLFFILLFVIICEKVNWRCLSFDSWKAKDVTFSIPVYSQIDTLLENILNLETVNLRWRLLSNWSKPPFDRNFKSNWFVAISLTGRTFKRLVEEYLNLLK